MSIQHKRGARVFLWALILATVFVFAPARHTMAETALFTSDELSSLSQYDEIYIIGAPDAAPYEYFHNGSYIGAMPLLFERIGALTGLKFTYISPSLFAYDRYELADNKQAEIVSVVTEDAAVLKEHGFTRSDVCFVDGQTRVYFAYTKLADEQLIRTINKALAAISPEERTALSLRAAAQYAAMDYPTYVYALIIAGWMLFLVVLILFLVRRKKSQKVIDLQKTTDTVTGIGNSEYFRTKFTQLLESKRLPLYSIIYLSANIEYIREYYGDAEAEDCLRNIALELTNKCHDDDVVARIGENSFAIACVADTQEMVRLKLTPLLEAIRSYPTRFARDYLLVPRAGATLASGASYELDPLLFEAKQAYKYACEQDFDLAFCNEQLMLQVATDKGLSTELSYKLRLEEFTIHALPLLGAQKKDIVGADALVRWQHPERGLIAPAAFISLLEETGQIIELNYHVFALACQWQEQRRKSGLPPITVYCRFSSSNFLDAAFQARMSGLAEQYRLQQGEIAISINESILLRGGDAMLDKLLYLHNMGIMTALDNFDGASASLRMLKQYPIEYIRIDRAMIQEPLDEQDAAILASVIQLGHSLDRTLLCSGIETEKQADLLTTLGCDMLQGFYFYMPLPCEQFDLLNPA